MALKDTVAKIAKVLAWMTLGSILVLLIGCALELSKSTRPPQLANLPQRTEEIEPEFQRRLLASFPLGTSERALVAGLSNWGFKFSLNSKQRLWATLDAPSAVCSESFSVEWEVNEKALLTALKGYYHLSCL